MEVPEGDCEGRTAAQPTRSSARSTGLARRYIIGADPCAGARLGSLRGRLYRCGLRVVYQRGFRLGQPGSRTAPMLARCPARMLSLVEERMEPLRFAPELFEQRNEVLATLADAGYTWLSHFSSVDVMHDVYGIEVCGIHHRDDARDIQEILIRMFPAWHAG